jgi:hypothetical protein
VYLLVNILNFPGKFNQSKKNSNRTKSMSMLFSRVQYNSYDRPLNWPINSLLTWIPNVRSSHSSQKLTLQSQPAHSNSQVRGHPMLWQSSKLRRSLISKSRNLAFLTVQFLIPLMHATCYAYNQAQMSQKLWRSISAHMAASDSDRHLPHCRTAM